MVEGYITRAITNNSARRRIGRAVVVADQIGLKAIVLDVIEDDGPDITEKRREFYARVGFLNLPQHPMRMFIRIVTIRNYQVS